MKKILSLFVGALLAVMAVTQVIPAFATDPVVYKAKVFKFDNPQKPGSTNWDTQIQDYLNAEKAAGRYLITIDTITEKRYPIVYTGPNPIPQASTYSTAVSVAAATYSFNVTSAPTMDVMIGTVSVQ